MPWSSVIAVQKKSSDIAMILITCETLSTSQDYQGVSHVGIQLTHVRRLQILFHVGSPDDGMSSPSGANHVLPTCLLAI